MLTLGEAGGCCRALQRFEPLLHRKRDGFPRGALFDAVDACHHSGPNMSMTVRRASAEDSARKFVKRSKHCDLLFDAGDWKLVGWSDIIQGIPGALDRVRKIF